MKIKPILIVAGDPHSIFFEIFFKSFQINIKSPIILICCKNLLKNQIKKFKIKKKIREINLLKLNEKILDNKKINLICIKLNNMSSQKSQNNYIKRCFEVAFSLIKKNYSDKLINGPIEKKTFLKKNFLGITEYIAAKFNIKKIGMLIYNKNLSVCPLTTHLPIKLVSKFITKKNIEEKLVLLNTFFKKNLNYQPKIAITGLNPHCESILKFNEDEKIIKPIIEVMKKRNINVKGPFSADTIFSNKNRRLYDVIIGMYHDQVLTPIKTIYEYDAINITMGLPFLRVTPDHGPNKEMVGKNISNPTSLIRALEFLDSR